MRRSHLVLSLAVLLGGCCKAPEEYAVSVSSVHDLTFAWSDRTVVLHMGGRISEAELFAAGFQPMYEVIRGRAGNAEAVVITLAEIEPVTNETVSLTLALPAALARGARYEVRGVFGGSMLWRDVRQAWGTRKLQQGDGAEVAFSTSAYTFPPGTHTATFVATQADGTVDIVERGTGWFHAVVALRLMDADGRVVNVSGKVQAQAESYRPPCT
jgi:hypothetical protein